MEWTSISVKHETVEKLRENKPDGVTWDYFLTGLVESEADA